MMTIRNALIATIVAALAAGAGPAFSRSLDRSLSRTPASGARPFAMRPFASSSTFYTFGGSLAGTQWVDIWFRGNTSGCYDASGTGAAQLAFLGGGLGPRTEGAGSPETPDCGSYRNGGLTYPEVDFTAGDAPLSTSQNNTYKSSSVLRERGSARVTPIAGAALSEAFNTSGLPTNLAISNAQLCGIWKGTIKNWNAVTNQATGRAASATSLPLSLVYGTYGSGSTFIHTAHLNAICAGGYGPVGNDFPTAAAGSATSIGAFGDDGIASTIAAQKGSIGYVAPGNLITGEASAALENTSGRYYTPTPAAIAAAFTSLTDRTPPPGYPAPITGQQVNVYLTNPSASGSYAEVGFTYAYVYTCYPTTFGASAGSVKSFFGYNPRFPSVVYAPNSVRETGLVNLGSSLAGDGRSVIAGLQSGSTYNPSTHKCS